MAALCFPDLSLCLQVFVWCFFSRSPASLTTSSPLHYIDSPLLPSPCQIVVSATVIVTRFQASGLRTLRHLFLVLTPSSVINDAPPSCTGLLTHTISLCYSAFGNHLPPPLHLTPLCPCPVHCVTSQQISCL